MHLSSADMKASREGFKFLVLSPTGARKCYCTTAKEAKAEAGKGGKIVVLARGRYAALNPSSGAKQHRAWWDFGRQHTFILKDSSGREQEYQGTFDEAINEAKAHNLKIEGVHGPGYGTITVIGRYPSDIVRNPRKRRNPTAEQVGLRNPKAKYIVDVLRRNKKSALKEKGEFGSLAKARQQIKRLPIFYDYVATIHKGDTLVETYYCGIMGWKLASNIHAEKLNPAKRRNPTAHMIGFQRNPTGTKLTKADFRPRTRTGYYKRGNDVIYVESVDAYRDGSRPLGVADWWVSYLGSLTAVGKMGPSLTTQAAGGQVRLYEFTSSGYKRVAPEKLSDAWRNWFTFHLKGRNPRRR